MFRFIHVSDIHLDSPLRGLELPEDAPRDQIRNAARHALDNLIELALREAVSFVLIAGDLYDGDWKDFNTGICFNQRMAKLRDAKIPVYIVSGNHDASSQITKTLRLPDNVHVFPVREPGTMIIDDIDVAIHGQGFASRSVIQDISCNYPLAKKGLFNIGLLHTALNGREGHDPYAPCTVEGLLAKGYQYWALGHIHQREVVFSDPWIVFSGNIQGRHIREQGQKGCTMVTVEDGRVSKVEHVDLDVLRWSLCRVDAGGCANTDEVYERVQDAFEKELSDGEGRPIVIRLELFGATAAHQKLQAQPDSWWQDFRSLAAGLGGAGLWLEKIRFNTRREGSEGAIFMGSTPVGRLLENIRGISKDTEALHGIDPDLSSFINKLPAEVRGGEDPFDPSDPVQWGEIISDVKELLAARLIHTEGQIR